MVRRSRLSDTAPALAIETMWSFAFPFVTVAMAFALSRLKTGDPEVVVVTAAVITFGAGAVEGLVLKSRRHDGSSFRLETARWLASMAALGTMTAALAGFGWLAPFALVLSLLTLALDVGSCRSVVSERTRPGSGIVARLLVTPLRDPPVRNDPLADVLRWTLLPRAAALVGSVVSIAYALSVAVRLLPW